MSLIVLFTNMKSHTGFRLVPASVFNGVIVLILLYFTELDSFADRLCHNG